MVPWLSVSIVPDKMFVLPHLISFPLNVTSLPPAPLPMKLAQPHKLQTP
jgi:hypothetical protein